MSSFHPNVSVSRDTALASPIVRPRDIHNFGCHLLENIIPNLQRMFKHKWEGSGVVSLRVVRGQVCKSHVPVKVTALL